MAPNPRRRLRFFWLRLQHWLPEELLRAGAVHEAGATAGHGDLHDVVPALATQRAAEASRGGAEHSARFSLHCVCPVVVCSLDCAHLMPASLFGGLTAPRSAF